MPSDSVQDPGSILLRWCLTEGMAISDMSKLLQAFALRALDLGVPLRRLNLTLRTLHPLVVAENWIWRFDREDMQYNRFTWSSRAGRDYLQSPLRPIIEGMERQVRYVLKPGPDQPFPLFLEYVALGMTEYLAFALNTEEGRPVSVSVMTDQPEGLTPEQRSTLDLGLMGLRPLLELYVERSIAASVVSTYIGHFTGPRVLAGDIRRGTVSTLPAVVWFCDLRNFTPLTIRLGNQAVVDLLNHFFGAVGEAIEENQGEILKFIGDAALAIFPLHPDKQPAEVCQRALRAARSMLDKLQALTAAHPELPPLSAAAALHIGDVAYGNIGAPMRLDFTVVGAAVNLSARLGSLAARLGEPVITSEDFALASGLPLRPLGAHALKGIEGVQPVFGLPQDSPPEAEPGQGSSAGALVP